MTQQTSSAFSFRSFLALLMSILAFLLPFQKDGLIVSAKTDGDDLVIGYENRTNRTVHVEPLFILEKLTEDGAVKIEFSDETAFPEVYTLLRHGGSDGFRVNKNTGFATPLTDGSYRLTLRYEKTGISSADSYTAVTEFTIG